MELVISIIVCLILLLNLIFQFQENRDERWKLIMNRPLHYAFTLLMLGYSVLIWVDGVYSISYNTFKTALGFVFTGVLVIYMLILLWERRKYS